MYYLVNLVVVSCELGSCLDIKSNVNLCHSEGRFWVMARRIPKLLPSPDRPRKFSRDLLTAHPYNLQDLSFRADVERNLLLNFGLHVKRAPPVKGRFNKSSSREIPGLPGTWRDLVFAFGEFGHLRRVERSPATSFPLEICHSKPQLRGICFFTRGSYGPFFSRMRAIAGHAETYLSVVACCRP